MALRTLVFFLREKGDFDPPRGRACGAAPSQHTSTQTDNRQPRMDPSRGQQQPTGENAPGEHFHIVGPRRNQSVAPQGAAGQQAASGGRRARSERSDQPSPNARGGATQRTHDGSVALTGGPMAIGHEVAPAQAQQLMLQHQYWQQQQQPQTMQQAIQFPPGPYSHASSGGCRTLCRLGMCRQRSPV